MSITNPFDYRAFLKNANINSSINNQPVNGTFELTERCNLKCQMCYISPKTCNKKDFRELSSTQWVDLAHQAKENGMVFLTITGGEVFLREDFFEIYTPLTRMGLIITLLTNGTLLSDKIVNQLSEAPPNRTEITLYGASADTYEGITNIPGSYDRCCSGIDLMLKRKIPLLLKTTLTQNNKHELEDMRRMAKNWGVPFSAGWLISKRRDGTLSSVENYRIPASECIKLENTDGDSVAKWTEATCFDTSEKNDNFYCQAGLSSFSLNSQGEMNGCIELTQPASRPLEIGFISAWRQVREYVNMAPPLSKDCQHCEALNFCPRCPAWSFIETGTLTEPVNYLCEIAKERKECYGKKNGNTAI